MSEKISGETVASRLARWVVALQYDELSAAAVFHAKHCILDTLSVELLGATLPWVQPVYRYIRTMGGDGDASVAYYGDRLSVPYAAYINSAFAYSCELQHHGSWESAHPGVIVIPTIQALGEKLGSGGQQILVAIVAGYEVQGRLGPAIYEQLHKNHFHPQGVLGVFGAAAAAGKLLGLNEEQLTHAFAIAASHASAILEYDQAGGEVKRIHGAIALRSGIQSAFLAKEGFTGPRTVFEGRRGVFASFGNGKAKPESVFSKLGEPYCVTRCRFRVYPTIGACHAPLDILSDLVEKHGFNHRDVQSIRVGLRDAWVLHVGTAKRPQDVISAQASLGYSLGIRLVKGNNEMDMYTNPQLWNHPEVLSIADKFESYALADKAHPLMAKMEIKLMDGRVLRGEQEDAKGSEALPFSPEVIPDKFKRLARNILSQSQVEQVIYIVDHLEELHSIAGLAPSLVCSGK